jgi:type IV secretion system protein TrbL
MQTASPAAIDEFLARFTSQVGNGFGLIQGDVQTVFASLMVISIGLSGLLWALDENQNIPGALIRKVLLFGFFAWLISGWRTLSLTIVNGFVGLGLKAGGGSLAVSDLMQSPSVVVRDGLDVAFTLLKYMGRVASEGMGTGFFTRIDAILVTGVAAIGVILAFVILGVEIAITIIEFYIVTLIAFVTVPFGILTQTAFMSERAIGYVVSIGVKLMALALIVSIGEQIFTSYTVSAEPAWEETCGLLLAAITMVMLALKIPAIAGALISGGPQLSAGSAAAGVAGVAAAVGGVALAGRMAAAGLAGAGGKAASAGGAGPAARLAPSGGGSGGPGSGGNRPPSGGGPSNGSGFANTSDGGSTGGARPAGLDSLVEQARGSYAPPTETEPQAGATSAGSEVPAPAPPASAAVPSGHGPSRWTKGAAAVKAARTGDGDGPSRASMPRVHPPSDDEA